MSSHGTLRFKVCAVCFDSKGRTAEARKISASLVQAIQEFVLPTFSLDDPTLPCGLCTTCRVRLTQHIKSNEEAYQKCHPRTLDIVTSYSNSLNMATRTSPKCCCRICNYARQTGLRRAGFLKPEASSTSPKILKICARCKQQLFPGCKHSDQDCNSKAMMYKNIADLAGDAIDKVAANVVKGKANDVSSDTIYLDGQFGGKPLQLRVNRPSPKARMKLSMMDIQELRGIGLSDRQVHNTVGVLKRKNSKVVEPYLRQKVVAEKRMLDRFFDRDILEAVHENSKKSKKEDEIINRPVVFCKDIVGLRDRVADARGLDDEKLEVKLGLDSGRGKDIIEHYSDTNDQTFRSS